MNDLFYVPFPPLSLPTPGHRAYWAAVRTLDRIVARLRRPRGANDRSARSLAGAAAGGPRPLGDGDSQLLHDEAMTMLLAGHDSTANTLAWACYLLAQHPDVAQRLRAEVAAVLGGRAPTADDLPRLPYTRMVLDETMRLYPSAWILSRRRAEAADEIDGYRVPAGTLLWSAPTPCIITHTGGPIPRCSTRSGSPRTLRRAPFACSSAAARTSASVSILP